MPTLPFGHSSALWRSLWQRAQASQLLRLARLGGAAAYQAMRASVFFLGTVVLLIVLALLTVPSLREHVAALVDAWPVVLGEREADYPDHRVDEAFDWADDEDEAAPGTELPRASGTFLEAFAAPPALELFAQAGMSAVQIEQIRRYIARKYRVAYSATGVLVNTAYQVGERYRLEPLLILAVTAIESRYNPLAESHVGAQGLMQVMPEVHHEKLAPFGESAGLALDPVVNMYVGGQILHDCIRRRATLASALACYVGAIGPDRGYGAKVLAEYRLLARAAGVTPKY